MSVRHHPSAPAARWSLSEAITALLFGALLLQVLLNLNGIWYLLFFEPGQTRQGRTAWVLIGMSALALALTVRVPMHKSLGLPGFLFLGSLISYLIIGTAPRLWNVVDQVPIVPILHHGVYFVVVMVTASATMAIVRHTGVVRFLQWILVILMLGCVSILATPWLATSDLLLQFGTRLYGVYLDPNEAGHFAAMTVWLGLALVLCNANRILASAAVAVAVLAILATTSRAAILFVLLLVILFFAYWIVLRPKIMMTAIALSIVGALVAGLAWLVFQSAPILASALLLPEKLDTLLSLLSGDIRIVTTSERWDLLLGTLQQIEAAPLVGSGFDELHSLEDVGYCLNQASCAPHNFYLTLWREAGFVPVVLYLGYLFSMLGTSLALPQRAAIVTAVGWTVARAFQDLFSDSGYQTLWQGCLSGLAFGLLMHEIRRYRESWGSDPAQSSGNATSVS